MMPKEGYKLCPYCAEEIKEQAIKCRFCGSMLEEMPSTAQDHALQQKLQQFQKYIPKEMADKILSTKGKIEGERRNVTVLFADISGFTAMSEILDAEEVTNITNECFKLLVDTIYKYEGTVDKFIGDGVMALFGAPISHENDAERAVLTAIEMQEKVKELSHEIKEKTGIELRISIGINTGMVVAGNVGSDLRMEYTVMGDTVNTTARLEGVAEPGQILIGETTYKRVKELFDMKELAEVFVKGKKEKIKVYYVTALKQRWLEKEKVIPRIKLIGRKRELEHLCNCLDKVLHNKGQAVSLIGEAGVGKSRLSYEFENYIKGKNIIYLKAKCLSYGENIYLMPVIQILNTYFGITDEDNEKTKKEKITERIIFLDENLKEIIPSVGSLLSVKFEGLPEQMGIDQRKQMIFYGVKKLLLKSAENIPIIIEIEDMHWIDDATLELLNYLIEEIKDLPIFFLYIHRPTFTPNWYDKDYYSQVNLNPLNVNESREHIREILKITSIPEELQQIIISKTEGNPFYLEELIKNLIEDKVIEKRNSEIIIHKELSKLNIPDTVQGVIMARLDRLEEELKRVLQLASVIGRDFSYKLLKALTEEEIKLNENLAKLQNLDIVYEKDILPEIEYIFKHVLTREVTYNSILIKRRQQYHKRIANIIENLYKDKLEEYYELLAYHYAHSDDKEKAEEYLLKAGWKVHELNSYDAAIEYYKKVLEIKSNNLKAIVSLGWGYGHKGDCEKAIEYFKKGIEIYPEDYICYGNLQILLQGVGRFDEAESISKMYLYKSPARTYLSLVGFYTLKGEYDKALDAANKFVNLDFMSDNIPWTINMGSVDIKSLFQTTEKTGIDPAYKHSVFAPIYVKAGRLDEALDEYKNILRYHPDDVYLQFTMWWCYISSGNFYEALNTAKKIHELNPNFTYKITPNAPPIPLGYSALGLSYTLCGNKEEAIKLFEKAIGIAPKSALLYMMWGFTYFLFAEYDKAVDKFKKVEELKFDFTDLVRDVGISLKGTPLDETQFYFNFAFSYQQLKQYEKAIEYYNKVIILDPNNEEAKKNLEEIKNDKE